MSDSEPAHGDQVLPEGYRIAVLYEDGEIMIVDKPWDIRVDGRFEVTVEKLVRKGLKIEMDCFRLCNQLDYATSGILVLGLSSKGAGNCNKLFTARKTRKWYLAIGEGDLGDLEWKVGEPKVVREKISEVPDDFRMQISHDGKECETIVTPVLGNVQVGAVEGVLFLVQLITGRRHQIRLHLKHLGFPIVGDATYNQPRSEVARMMLHAWKLILPFPHKTVSVEAGPDEFFSHTNVPFTDSLLPLVV